MVYYKIAYNARSKRRGGENWTEPCTRNYIVNIGNIPSYHILPSADY